MGIYKAGKPFTLLQEGAIDSYTTLLIHSNTCRGDHDCLPFKSIGYRSRLLELRNTTTRCVRADLNGISAVSAPEPPKTRPNLPKPQKIRQKATQTVKNSTNSALTQRAEVLASCGATTATVL